MTSDETGGSGSGVPGGRRRRPPSTIELEASELASEPGTPGDSPDSPRSAPDPEPAAEVRSAETEFGPWGFVGAGGAGAAIAVLLLGGLWIFGVLPAYEESEDELSALPDKVAVLEKQVGDLSARMQALPDPRRGEEIEARLRKLEATVATPSAPAADSALAQKLADLDRRIEQALAAANEAKGRADAAANQAQKADAQSAGNPAERAALEALAARVATLEQERKTDEQRLGRVAAGADRAVRLALVAMELRVAVERGAPFAAELAAAKQLAPDPSARTWSGCTRPDPLEARARHAQGGERAPAGSGRHRAVAGERGTARAYPSDRRGTRRRAVDRDRARRAQGDARRYRGCTCRRRAIAGAGASARCGMDRIRKIPRRRRGSRQEARRECARGARPAGRVGRAAR